MSYVITKNGRPVCTSASVIRGRQFAQKQEERNDYPDASYEFTATGKLMRVKQGVRAFTGWEVHDVQEVR